MLLNADLGESFGHWNMGDDEAIMSLIDQANIACGYHAGDPLVMQTCVKLAVKHKVSIGAHVAYPDLQGFGRRSMQLSNTELQAMIIAQLACLDGIARCHNTRVEYVKPHGALYNDMMRSHNILESVFDACSQFHSNVSLMVQSLPENKLAMSLSKKYSLPVLFEAFSDRGYTDDGLLQARTLANAILPADECVQRAKELKGGGRIKSINGKTLALKVDSLCVHSDTKDAIEVCRLLRQVLAA